MKDAAELAVFMFIGALVGLLALFMLALLFMLAKSTAELFLEAPLKWRVAVVVAAGAGVIGAVWWYATLVPR